MKIGPLPSSFVYSVSGRTFIELKRDEEKIQTSFQNLMRFVSFVLLSILLVSCSPKSGSYSGGENHTRYYYVFLKPCDVYEGPETTSRRLKSLAAGDTISTLNEPIKLQGWQSVEHHNYQFFIRNQSVYAITQKNFKEKAGYRPTYNPIDKYPSASSTITQFESSTTESTMYSTPTTGATIQTGKRGGKYYYNSKGNKTYIRRK